MKRIQKAGAGRFRPIRLALLASALATLAVLILVGVRRYERQGLEAFPGNTLYSKRPTGTVTFAEDIAPIIYQRCSVCHRPGQAAPFPLLTYTDVRKKAPQVVEVTERRFMPPWLPARGVVDYAEERILTTEELGLLHQWVDEGAPEGNPANLPPVPQSTDGWQLGTPDLVVRAPEAYLLSPEGKDVYRNFVLPIPLTDPRYVEAVEFRPGNPKVVHHAAMRIDRSRYSRQIDEREPGPGFGGMVLPETTEAPSGQFLNWQPGKLPYRSPPGLGWKLEAGTDFIVQLHLHPSGKPETVQSEIGLYFTRQPPTNSTFKIILDWPAIDIPPGTTDYVVEDEYVLPVSVHALMVFPHAHYLAREMQAFAVLPTGTRQWLLWIKDWDFNWQGDYRFAHPIPLPKGTKLQMRFTYDNSTNNVRNPNRPPQRVVFGPQTTDEMGELWLQVLPDNTQDRSLLAQDYFNKQVEKTVAVNRERLRVDPNNVRAQVQLGKGLWHQGKMSESLLHLQAAVEKDPNSEEAYYFIGLIFRVQKQFARAQVGFETVLRLNPQSFKAHGNLGQIFMEQGDLMRAEEHFLAALRLNPEDVVARQGLETLRRSKDRTLP
jgi:hypothetical protein